MHPPLVRAEIAWISEIPDDDKRTIGGETIGDRPADVGAAVAFLASDDARFVSGQVVVVDGARMSKLSLPPSLAPDAD